MRTDYRTRLKSELLSLLKEHKAQAMSAKDIYECLQKRGQSANLATVYRQLDRLVEEKALVKSIPEHGKSAHYLWSEAGACYEHLHMQCMHCGRILHLDCHDADSFARHLEDEHGFVLCVQKTVLYGVCADCAKENA